VVPADKATSYDGTSENVAAISEAQQASNHVELAELAACDPAVRSLLYFPLIDDRGTSTGFQSGNLFADLAEKQSYTAMKDKIASARGRCQAVAPGMALPWSHTGKVLGAAGSFGGPGTSPGSQPARRPTSSGRIWAFSATAAEDTTYRATLRRVSAAGRSPRSVLASAGAFKAYRRPLVKFDPRALPAGYYDYSITLAAATNPKRTTTLTSKPFRVGSPGLKAARKRPTSRSRGPG
jgi:hypothetical protein